MTVKLRNCLQVLKKESKKRNLTQLVIRRTQTVEAVRKHFPVIKLLLSAYQWSIIPTKNPYKYSQKAAI